MNIVILDSGYKSYAFEQELFKPEKYKLSIYRGSAGAITEKKEFAKDAHGLLVRHSRIDEAFLKGAKNLKAIVRYGVGYDNIDLEACTRMGIKVANVQGYAVHSVSDHALALMFACCRGMWDVKEQVATGFGAPPVEDVIEMHDKTLGIIGLGRIGSELARKARLLVNNVVAYDPYREDEYFVDRQVQQVPLDKLLKEADIISLHCNLTTETRHMLDEAAFFGMKKRPVVVNTARGEVIEENALITALQKGFIHSAGLDVYANEPVTEKQDMILNHSRTICTGHYAWYSDRASKELQQRAAGNLFDLLNGKPVEDCLNP